MPESPPNQRPAEKSRFCDYPAAHSMDSTWFAVDEEGHVAFFDTGEGGSMPESDFPAGGESFGRSSHGLEDTELLARVLMARAVGDERLRGLLPDKIRTLEKKIGEGDGWDLIPPLLRSFGVWTYACPEQSPWPYISLGEVANPIRIDELDPDTRKKFQNAKLGVRFTEAPILAPGEHVPVVGWDSFWLDLEGRPHPTVGREKDFERIVGNLGDLSGVEAPEHEAGELLEGEALYRAVADLIRDPEPWVPYPQVGKKKSWWKRLLGLG